MSSPAPEAKQQLNKAMNTHEAGENPREQQVWRSKAEEDVQGSELSFPSPCSEEEDSKAPVEHQRGCQQAKVPTFPISQKNLFSAPMAEFFFFFSFSVQRNCLFRKIKEPKTQRNGFSAGEAAEHARPRWRVAAAPRRMQRAGCSLSPCFHH